MWKKLIYCDDIALAQIWRIGVVEPQDGKPEYWNVMHVLTQFGFDICRTWTKGSDMP